MAKYIDSVQAAEMRDELRASVAARLERALDECSACVGEQLREPDDVSYLAESERIADFYTSMPEFTYPGRNHFVCSLPDGLELWFRIECDSCLFAGTSVYNARAHELICFQDIPINTANALYSAFGTSAAEVPQNCWWLTRRYLTDANGEKPDFHLMNDACLALLDDVGFKAFIGCACHSIQLCVGKAIQAMQGGLR